MAQSRLAPGHHATTKTTTASFTILHRQDSPSISFTPHFSEDCLLVFENEAALGGLDQMDAHRSPLKLC